jgi:site-specific recombinase XerD
MPEEKNPVRDVSTLLIPEVGRLVATGSPWCPYQLLDGSGDEVGPVTLYLADLQAASRSIDTLRSYGMDLLRWWRFLAAVDVPWDKATRIDARDFTRWMQIVAKPVRPHWRHRDREPGSGAPDPAATLAKPSPGMVNTVTGKPTPGLMYAAATRAHCETVLREFYDFHTDQGAGPIINPFPLERRPRVRRPHAHHNPLDEFQPERTGRYRPKQPKRVPRRIPDERFDQLFVAAGSHRDRALLAFYISTAARASELLGARQADVAPGDQTITVVRKGSGEMQALPASVDAFVWLRLYQEQMRRLGIPRGRNEPLWWTLRRPWRQLNYHAARAMFQRLNAALGANWTLHDMRHTASYRMAQDPEMQLTHVQRILGHAWLSTTQIYLSPSEDEVIRSALEFHARQAQRRANPTPPQPTPGYKPSTLQTLFGEGM